MRSHLDARPSFVRVLAALGATVLLLTALGGLAVAQDDVDRLEDLQEERERVAEEAATTAAQIEVDTATVDELADALALFEGNVRIQESRLEDAQRSYESALEAVQTARRDRRRVLNEIDDQRDQIAEIALASFTGEDALAGDDMTELALSEDPGEAVRIRHLVQQQTGSLGDGLDRLRALEVEAEMLIDAEQSAASDVAEQLEEVERRAADVIAAKDQQATFVAAAEIQLEARVAEATILAERDAELATQISEQQHAINRRIARTARAAGVEIPPPVELEDVVTIEFPDHRPDFTIQVHRDIAERTEALFIQAFEEGIDLGGWGYRPIQLQVELRRAHCGGTEEDIWHKSAFECAPPTARPGFSKHEQGRAVDFTINGRSITDPASWAFRWLQRNAPRYGFENLPEEPWHWSIG